MTDKSDSTEDAVAAAALPGDETEPLGGATSGERDYVAVNAGGVSGEKHTPTADEEVGRGAGYDPSEERYPDEERGD
ncbi:hypothetical protein AS850_00900 [Frondihabitans sp. 762G35]|uniref:hypothetical protein n=1 Tax=Frondihabitans sp. 762G35 TaxID=1446794 RepID=UPI000D200F75|nr:hypothetical protein [Frondihabitans sp. 762G35]ARC55631.1 hypothetical protein AS850_00900 [Frondihabitans sp. 762G35]